MLGRQLPLKLPFNCAGFLSCGFIDARNRPAAPTRQPCAIFTNPAATSSMPPPGTRRITAKQLLVMDQLRPARAQFVEERGHVEDGGIGQTEPAGRCPG